MRPLGQVQRDERAAQPRLVHCWVSGPDDAPGLWPGVLIAWRRSGPLWFGRVSYVVLDQGDAVVVDAWVPEAALRPAG